ncbi:hypothetical protein ASPWEDRAFT_622473 [Aspergillus wentii DTO 134E9]|uniref:Uncharacterized protein n=1 Tax=Aspergillus wentii DTO 134E9 TaxID=1073089 RepID=A0A1L9REV4_ASPWE|nr:uncharacterized protein ASPWEDRAFT_622473 [Aspergillus wentii DTO 134E9]OJJ33455.1 hypothetical protein ASPWEDRAFT_622473 [Aspergillus wentii DTO 134E9]
MSQSIVRFPLSVFFFSCLSLLICLFTIIPLSFCFHLSPPTVEHIPSGIQSRSHATPCLSLITSHFVELPAAPYATLPVLSSQLDIYNARPSPAFPSPGKQSREGNTHNASKRTSCEKKRRKLGSKLDK